MVYETVLYAVIASMVYAASAFLKKTVEETFDWQKFIATVFTGFIIGLVAMLQGFIPDQITIETQLALFAGATVIIENFIRILFKIIRGIIKKYSLDILIGETDDNP